MTRGNGHNGNGAASPSILVLLTTYDRPRQYRATLRAMAATGEDITVIAMQDGGDRYVVDEQVQGMPVVGLWKVHGGKRLYWQTINGLWKEAQKRARPRPTYVIQLPDDFTYQRWWLQSIIASFGALGGYGVLNVFPCHRDRQWGNVRRLRGSIYHNSFIDGAFITTPQVLDRMRWRVPQVEDEWFRDGRSSGVWRQFTHSMKFMGVPMFQLAISPISGSFDAAKSKMNPDRVI